MATMFSHGRLSHKAFFFMLAALALATTVFMCYVSMNFDHLARPKSNYQNQNLAEDIYSADDDYREKTPVGLLSPVSVPINDVSDPESSRLLGNFTQRNPDSSQFLTNLTKRVGGGGGGKHQSQRSPRVRLESNGNNMNNNKKMFHDREIFLQDYKNMNNTLKIYVYPHPRNDFFANLYKPVNFEPGGNYASESYFKKILFESHFITKNPNKADLFYLPFSIAQLRHDRRIGAHGIPKFVKSYVSNISRDYPYWNRTGGADHFYVACHSIGRSAMDKTPKVKVNAIQVVCSSSYFLTGYVSHKDVALPQIWPRKDNPTNLATSKRKKLAFFAGAANSRERKRVVQVWGKDAEIHAHSSRLKTPYADQLLGSKFCLHIKGFEVNTARVADSLYYGCVPVILANHYELPFADILNWKSFSVVVDTSDIPLLKKILKGIGSDGYSTLQKNVLEVRKHFQWNSSPVDYDVFYMVMYELWLRRSSIRIELSSSIHHSL